MEAQTGTLAVRFMMKGCSTKSVHDCNDGVQDQNIERMFPVAPFKHGGQSGSDDSKHGADLGHKLEDGAEQCPQRSSGHANDVKTDQPQESDGQRILKLRDEPVFQRATGDLKVFSNFHEI